MSKNIVSKINKIPGVNIVGTEVIEKAFKEMCMMGFCQLLRNSKMRMKGRFCQNNYFYSYKILYK